MLEMRRATCGCVFRCSETRTFPESLCETATAIRDRYNATSDGRVYDEYEVHLAMARPTSAPTSRERLTCPQGQVGPFRYVEQIECVRYVRGVSSVDLQADAVRPLQLDVFSLYVTGEGYDEGKNPVLECHHYEVQAAWDVDAKWVKETGVDAEIRYEPDPHTFCGARFPVPDGMAINWL